MYPPYWLSSKEGTYHSCSWGFISLINRMSTCLDDGHASTHEEKGARDDQHAASQN